MTVRTRKVLLIRIPQIENAPPAAKNLFSKRFLELQKTFDMCFLCYDLLFDARNVPLTVGPYPLGCSGNDILCKVLIENWYQSSIPRSR